MISSAEVDMFIIIDYTLYIYDGGFDNDVYSVIISPDKDALLEGIRITIEVFFDRLFDADDDSGLILDIEASNNVYPPGGYSKTSFARRSCIEDVSRDIVSLIDMFEYISLSVPGNSIDNKKFPELAGNTLNVLDIYKVECGESHRIYI